MTLTGTLLRILGAAILLIAVQFASVAAKAHVGHSHGPDGHSIHSNGAAVGAVHTVASDETGSANRAAQAQPHTHAQSSAQAGAAVQNAGGALSGSDACLMDCCGTGMGCCGAALAAVSSNLPPRVGSPRIGFARLISVREADPRGLRKPPRSLA